MRPPHPLSQKFYGLNTPSVHWIPRSCCGIRPFSTSYAYSRELPWYKRVQDRIIPSKREQEASEQRQRRIHQRLSEAEKVAATGLSPNLSKVDEKTGNEYEIATEAAYLPGYVPSTTWDGLRRIGGEEWERKEAMSGRRDIKYHSSVPKHKKTLSDEQWHTVIGDAVLKQMNKRAILSIADAEGAKSSAQSTGIGPDADTASSEATTEPIPTIEGVNDPHSEHDGDSERSSVPSSPLTAKAGRSGTSPINLAEIDIKDPAFKLEISKQILIKTGHRISDHKLSLAVTAEDLYHSYKGPEKVKKLIKSPQVQMMNDIPNVKIHSKRVTRIDKDKSLGRWKFIEEELKNRDLPLPGTRLSSARPYIPELHPKRKRKSAKA